MQRHFCLSFGVGEEEGWGQKNPLRNGFVSWHRGSARSRAASEVLLALLRRLGLEGFAVTAYGERTSLFSGGNGHVQTLNLNWAFLYDV